MRCPHASTCISTAQARAKSAARASPDLGPRPFPWECPRKCVYACRLWRNCRKKLLPVLGCGICPANSRITGIEMSVKVLYESLWEALLKILVNCSQGLLHDLVQVLVRSSWRGPGEVLYVSLHDFVQVLVRRSCGDPVETLLKRSWRSSASVLMWKFFWAAHRKFLYEDLVNLFI